MARTEQTARKGGRYVWHQRNFIDHAGEQAMSVCWSHEEPDPPDESTKPPFSLQIYSTIRLEGDFSSLAQYLGSGIDSQGCCIYFDIYAEKSDLFCCVEHQRHEIAYRKAQVNASTLQSIRPIPKVSRDAFTDPRRHGFLIVITSDTYRNTSAPHNFVDPTGPLWVHFDRKFPHKSCIDVSSRLEAEPVLTMRSLGIPLEEIDVLPEKIEIIAARIQQTSNIPNSLSTLYGISLLEYGRPDYGLDEDEGLPTDPLITQGDKLSLQAQSLMLTDFQVINGPRDAITIISASISSSPDLRYLVYVPFLHYPGVKDSLESADKLFSASITSHLPSGKTIHFEFHKPQEPTLSSALSLHRTQMASRPNMSVGAIHTIKTKPDIIPRTPTRFYPCTQNAQRPFFPNIERYKTFLVVLDKPNFIEENGVLFLMTDGGKFIKRPWDEFEISGGPSSDYLETQVWRSAGMGEVARRLGMLVLEDM